MNINTVRAKEIQVWKDNHPEERISYEVVPVELRGQGRNLEVWRIPIKFLIYNIQNGRITAELMAIETERKRKLDATNTEDAKTIQQLLLSQDKDETEELEKDIKLSGQKQAGIITFDGTVINANRRMAVLSKLFEETGETKYEYLRVAILPKEVDQKDLWRIEAGIQFGKTFILNYPPVNEMLKLRDGKERGLSPKEISKILRGQYTVEDIEEELEVLKQIENYLVFIGKPKQYHEATIHVEKFRSLHKVIVSLKNRSPPSELLDINIIGFKLIQSTKVTNLNIRKLRQIAGIKKAKEELIRGAALSQDELIDSFDTALDMIDAQKAEDAPKRFITRALSAIENIDEKNPQLKTKEVIELLNQLEREIKRLKTT